MKRVGLLGGSFDPVHFGHLLLAECCREQLQLDAVWFLPAAQPPHKRGRSLAPAGDRIAMLQRAIGDAKEFAVDTTEVDRGGLSFTVDTLESLTSRLPDHRWYLILGADSLRDLPTWYQPQRILELATPVVAARGGMEPPDLGALRGLIGKNVPGEQIARRVEMPQMELSSTELRQRARDGMSLRFRTPQAVAEYIVGRGLYRDDDPAE